MSESLGGKGLGAVDMGAIMFEIACKDTPLATFFLLHNFLGLNAVDKLAHDKLKFPLLSSTIPLYKILGWALTEPGNGSEITTTARKIEGGYLLSGKKKQIGNGVDADYILTWACNESENNKVQCFLVDKDSKGLTTSQGKQGHRYRAVQKEHLILTDVFVQDSQKLEHGNDFKLDTQGVLKYFFIFVAWMATGVAAGALEYAMRNCIKDRTMKSNVQNKLEKCVGIVQQSILLCMQISRMYDQGSDRMSMGRIIMAKEECSRNVREVAVIARGAMAENKLAIDP